MGSLFSAGRLIQDLSSHWRIPFGSREGKNTDPDLAPIPFSDKLQACAGQGTVVPVLWRHLLETEDEVA